MRDRLLAAEKVKAIDWRDGALHLLDQRVLPSRESWVTCSTVDEVAAAIRSMVVRGAAAIGISAAYGLVLAARERIAEGDDWQAGWEEDYALLADTRPTGANLLWALKRMRDRLDRLKQHADPLAVLEAEAIDGGGIYLTHGLGHVFRRETAGDETPDRVKLLALQGLPVFKAL